MKSWSRAEIVDEWPGGLGWRLHERLQRTSHALLVDGRVWVIDPVDADGVEERVRALGKPAGVLQLLDRHGRDCAAWAERLGVPHRRAWEGVEGTPFERLPVRDNRLGREVALWEPSARTLVCADALGTLGFFRASGEQIGWHPLTRPFPPRSFARVQPERILVGHGAGVHEHATASLQEALRTARRRIPAALLALVRTSSWAASR